MITLTLGQVLFNDPDLAVGVAGTYNPTDLVPVHKISNPSVDHVAYQAIYIATGEDQ